MSMIDAKIFKKKNNVFNVKQKSEKKLENQISKTYKENNPQLNQPLNEVYARDIYQSILDGAILKNASDIHIEPFEKYVIIRLRIDGLLSEEKKISYDIYQQLLIIIKLDAGMNIAEKRLPQDGRVAIDEKYKIDIRASTLPTVYGEKMVLRILNRNSFLKKKEDLGFSKIATKKIENIINNKSGILLVTGATGSGKTTTLYSIISELNSNLKNIMTIEDPVEYKIDGVNQIQVNSKIGLTFDSGLKSILRQDPDVIMIGEIRDIETAKTAIKAATTGHLVISTLHTKDAISAVSRLIDMEIPIYLINASLIGVISQKLVRKVCKSCSEENEENIVKAVGCVCCNETGYSGRTAIYEVLEINNEIRKAIHKMRDYKTIKDVAIKNGMITFEETGKQLLAKNITTLDECMNIENIN